MYHLSLSPRPDKKYRMIFPDGKHIDFGATGYQDYTMHHNPIRKERYLKRHFRHEDWSSSGIETAGFWSRWLLWNLPSLNLSIKDTEKRFRIKIEY